MTQQETAFDKVGERFLSYYDTVRGYVRQEVTRIELEPYLGDTPLRIADIGGGDGRDSEWLSSQGHDVTLVDESAAMLHEARQRKAHIKVLHGTSTQLLKREGAGSFDMVLSHGVFMYILDHPEQHIQDLVKLAKPTGIISLLTKGYGGSVERLTRKGDENGLKQLEKTHQISNNLSERVWAFSEQELDAMLQQAGAQVLQWTGVRVETDDDYRPIAKISTHELNDIIRREAILPARSSIHIEFFDNQHGHSFPLDNN
jgi:2-polyprenyl-3-methyl-5-hydroxy-6-metoxy-1,4-benzoquinol methylase